MRLKSIENADCAIARTPERPQPITLPRAPNVNRAFRWASNVIQSMAGRSLTVLIFHRVLDERDELLAEVPDASQFCELMHVVRECFNVIGLEEGAVGLSSGSLPPRAAAITFDDGYADNCRVALPILRKLDLTATFFVATGYLGGGRMWNDTVIESVRRWPVPEMDLRSLGLGSHVLASAEDRRTAITALLARLKYMDHGQRNETVEIIGELCGRTLPNSLMMSSGEVRELAREGMTIGSHTVSHPILARIGMRAVEREITESREVLQEITGSTVRLFAYPNGRPNTDYRLEHVELVQKLGYRAAVSASIGVASSRSDRYQLPRIAPWRWDARGFRRQMLHNMLRTRYLEAEE